jgi:hypothetical protein
MFRKVLLVTQILWMYIPLYIMCEKESNIMMSGGEPAPCTNDLCDPTGGNGPCCDGTTCEYIKGYVYNTYRCRPNNNTCQTVDDCGTPIHVKQFECLPEGKCGMCIKIGFACSSVLKCCGDCDTSDTSLGSTGKCVSKNSTKQMLQELRVEEFQGELVSKKEMKKLQAKLDQLNETVTHLGENDRDRLRDTKGWADFVNSNEKGIEELRKKVQTIEETSKWEEVTETKGWSDFITTYNRDMEDLKTKLKKYEESKEAEWMNCMNGHEQAIKDLKTKVSKLETAASNNYVGYNLKDDTFSKAQNFTAEVSGQIPTVLLLLQKLSIKNLTLTEEN